MDLYIVSVHNICFHPVDSCFWFIACLENWAPFAMKLKWKRAAGQRSLPRENKVRFLLMRMNLLSNVFCIISQRQLFFVDFLTLYILYWHFFSLRFVPPHLAPVSVVSASAAAWSGVLWFLKACGLIGGTNIILAPLPRSVPSCKLNTIACTISFIKYICIWKWPFNMHLFIFCMLHILYRCGLFNPPPLNPLRSDHPYEAFKELNKSMQDSLEVITVEHDDVIFFLSWQASSKEQIAATNRKETECTVRMTWRQLCRLLWVISSGKIQENDSIGREKTIWKY